MSNFGFVYVMTNLYMPDLVKVGCTERSPHARARELSQGTAVPADFTVSFYIEVDDFQRVEKEFHRWLAGYRVLSGREFFSPPFDWLYGLFKFYPNQLSFTHVDLSDFAHEIEVNPWEDSTCEEPKGPPKRNASGGFE